MNEICRLCLAASKDLDRALIESSEILQKLETYLNVQLPIKDTLPTTMCYNCLKQSEDIFTFRDQLTQNEIKLIDMLKNNTNTDILYDEDIKIKPESKDTEKLEIKEEFETEDFYDTIYCKPNIKTNQTENKRPKKRKKDSKNTIKPTKNLKETKQPSPQIIKTENNTHSPLKCVTCFKLCDSQVDLSKHYRTEHSTNQIVNGQVTDDKYTLQNEGNEVRCKCNSCGEFFGSKDEIFEHIVSHMQERPFICKLCGRTYKSVYEIVRHGRVHGGYKLYCSFGCGYSSPHGGAIRDHERRHNNDHTYKCSICGKGFLVKTWYEQHQNIHNNIKPFVCDFCGMAFHMHRYLMAHRNKMHPDLSAIIRYMCVQCSFTCDNKKRLDTHMLEHKKGVESNLKHLCDVCGKAFARVDCLKNHKNWHSGIKPFTCSVCNKQFAKKFNLKVHERLHNGDTKPQCSACGKLFTQKSALLRHKKRRHPEEL